MWAQGSHPDHGTKMNPAREGATGMVTGSLSTCECGQARNQGRPVLLVRCKDKKHNNNKNWKNSKREPYQGWQRLHVNRF